MKIIDNLIDDKSLKNLSDTLLGVEFPWYYNSSKSSIDDGENYQFTHIFFSEKTIKTSHWKLVLPIIEKLEVKDLIYSPTPSWAFYTGYRKLVMGIKKHVHRSLSPNNAALTGFLMISI